MAFAAAAFVIVGFLALRPVPVFGRPGFRFSLSIFARFMVAAVAAAFAGDADFTDDVGFRGDIVYARYDFCGDPSPALIGDWGRVRELADFGDKTVDGLGHRRESKVVVIFVRFLGLGICSIDPLAFSLFAEPRASLRHVRQMGA